MAAAIALVAALAAARGAAALCTPMTSDICGAIDYDVFVNDTQTLEGLEAQAAALLTLMPLESVACQNLVRPIFCNMLFPPCDEPDDAPLRLCATSCGIIAPIVSSTCTVLSSIALDCDSDYFGPPGSCETSARASPASEPQITLPVCASGGAPTACPDVSLVADGGPAYPADMTRMLASGVSEVDLDASVAAVDDWLPLAAHFAPECAAQVGRLTCASNYVPCETVQEVRSTILGDVTVSLARPLPGGLPCESECDAVNAACAAFFADSGITPLNCTAANPLTSFGQTLADAATTVPMPLGFAPAPASCNADAVSGTASVVEPTRAIGTCEARNPAEPDPCDEYIVAGTTDPFIPDSRTSIFVPGNETVDSMIDFVFEEFTITSQLFVRLGGPTCARGLGLSGCGAVMAECETVQVPVLDGAVEVGVPQGRPCRSFCESLSQFGSFSCRIFLTTHPRVRLDPIDCTETDSAGFPLFPEPNFMVAPAPGAPEVEMTCIDDMTAFDDIVPPADFDPALCFSHTSDICDFAFNDTQAVNVTTPYFQEEGFELYVPAARTPTELDEVVSNITLLLPLLQAGFDDPMPCLDALGALACTAGYRPCADGSQRFGRSMVQFSQPGTNPCISLCHRTNDACAAIWEELGREPVDCFEVDSSTGAPLFLPVQEGENYLHRVFDNFFVNLTCTDFSDLRTTPYEDLPTPADCDVVGPEVTDLCSFMSYPDGTPFYDPAGFNLYIPALRGLDGLQESVSNITNVLPLVQSVAGQEQCAQALSVLTCTAALRECGDYTFRRGNTLVDINIPVTNPCRSMCDVANDVCGQFWIDFDLDPIDCLEVDANSGTPLFLPPEGFVTSPFDDVDVELSCQHWTAPALASLAPEGAILVNTEPLTCIEPLVLNPGSDPLCVRPCILNLYTDDQFQSAKDMILVLSYMSLFGDLFVILTWIVFREKKMRFPSNLALYMTLSSTVFAFVVLLSNWLGSEDVFCKDEATPYRSEGLCGFQAAVALYTALAVVLWWLLLVFTIYQLVVRENNQCYRYQRIYHAIAWGIPAIIVIMGVSANALGFTSVGGLWCFLSDAPDVNEAWGWVLFYGPLTIIVLTGLVFVALTIHKVWKVYRSKKTSLTKARRSQARLLHIGLMMLIILLFIVNYRIQVELVKDEVEQAFKDRIKCNAFTPDAECKLEKTPNYRAYMLNNFCIGVQGVFVFLFFGCQPHIFRIWRDYLVYGKRNFQRYDGDDDLPTGPISDSEHPPLRSELSDVSLVDQEVGAAVLSSKDKVEESFRPSMM